MRGQSLRLRTFVVLGLVMTTGVLFAGSGLACASFALDRAQSTLDFCFLFDCQNGAYGGLIDFCDRDANGDIVVDQSMLADCEQLQQGNQ